MKLLLYNYQLHRYMFFASMLNVDKPPSIWPHASFDLAREEAISRCVATYLQRTSHDQPHPPRSVKLPRLESNRPKMI